jgi:hypothetical protein
MMKEAPAEAAAPIVPPAAVTPPTPSVPSLNLGAADDMLTQTNATISAPKDSGKEPVSAPKPDLSKIDPYREPAI